MSRLNHLKQSLPSASLDGMVLNPGPSQSYLLGVHFYLFERPIVLLVSADRPPALVLPALEVTKAQSALMPLELFPYQDNPATWPEAFQAACRYLGWDQKPALAIGVELDRLRLLEARYIETVLPQARLIDNNPVMGMRMHKDADEIARMRKAVAIAEAGVTAAIPLMKIGMTELELSAEIGLQTGRAGSEIPGNPMVAAGPNGANPHASVSNRPLQRGDLLVIDFGAIYCGYCADLTRTFAVGEPPAQSARIHQVTLEANAAGRAAARPGIPAGDVDRAARAVIESAGYGPYFTHRTGHGLGTEPHEEPYIYTENSLLLEPGMVFTVEPGIYLPGQAGVRIEDDVVITPTGAETLSTMPRELVVVGE
jgi:Xaa-Pro dipeptidase